MIHLYIPAPRPLLPIRNTDWRYPRHLSSLSQYCAEFSITMPQDVRFDAWTHARFVLNIMRHRKRLPIPSSWAWKLSEFFRLPSHDPEIDRCHAIFSYERYPINATKPVIWMTGATDVTKLRARGWSETIIEQELQFKREASQRAAIVLFSTHFQRRQFEAQIRPHAARTGVLRFLIPFEAGPAAQVAAKWAAMKPVRVLFVGRAANRKGLPLVLAAYTELRRILGDGITLHVVTEECDGPVTFPAVPGITRELTTNRSRTTELMRAAHFLAMPSEEEVYGLVYAEAMASGAIPLATDKPNQRELLHDGRAGLLVERSVESIVHALLHCIENHGHAQQLVTYGRRVWEAEYQPSAVSTTLYDLASQVISTEDVYCAAS